MLQVASDTDSNRDSMDGEVNFDATASGSEDADKRVLDHDWTDPGSETAQLLLEVETLNARLTLTQQVCLTALS